MNQPVSWEEYIRCRPDEIDQVIHEHNFGVSPTHATDERRPLQMNTGKILIGLALLLITVSLVIHPAAARTTDIVPMVGQRNDAFGTALTPPAAFLANVLHSCQTSAGQDQSPVMADCDIPCAADLTVPPRTCTNDDHCTHITCSCVPAIRKMA